jgi:hypothetical protein
MGVYCRCQVAILDNREDQGSRTKEKGERLKVKGERLEVRD